MEVIPLSGLDGLKDTVATIGTFDGIHLGHRAILEQVTGDARRLPGRSLLLTFMDHPRILLKREPVFLINSPEIRREILAGLGLDYTVIIDQESVFDFSAEEFVERILVGRLGVREVVIGFNFRFGRKRTGDAGLLAEWGGRCGFRVKVVKPVSLDGAVVSSSRVRDRLAAGRVEEADRLLGRPYQVRGRVVPGRGRGREIGYPTANLEPDVPILLGTGIYAVEVQALDAAAGLSGRVRALASYGHNPTFGRLEKPVLEIHIPGFPGNWPGGGWQPISGAACGRRRRLPGRRSWPRPSGAIWRA